MVFVFARVANRLARFVFLCPLVYLEGNCSLVLFIGQPHAQHLCCSLRAAYFTIYTSVLLFRQRPTFSACFSSLPHFSAQTIAHLRWPIFQYLCSHTAYSSSLSRLVQMSFGSGLSQRRCYDRYSLLSCLEEPDLTVALNIILHISVTHIYICRANTSGFQMEHFGSAAVRDMLPVKEPAFGVFVQRLGVIRFLLTCQSQFHTEPFGESSLIPKRGRHHRSAATTVSSTNSRQARR